MEKVKKSSGTNKQFLSKAKTLVANGKKMLHVPETGNDRGISFVPVRVGFHLPVLFYNDKASSAVISK